MKKLSAKDISAPDDQYLVIECWFDLKTHGSHKISKISVLNMGCLKYT